MIRINTQQLVAKLKHSSLFKDSCWAMLGNGMGYALLLLAGVLIARLLGRDVYGEYGMVKTTMFYLAAFSTFGLGYTSTKFVAEYMANYRDQVRQIVYSALRLSTLFSCAIAVLVLIFAHALADYLKNPQLAMPFRMLAGLIVLRALSTTLLAILGGFHNFRATAFCNMVSGIVMVVLCIPFTYFWGLLGSFVALIVSQVLIVVQAGCYVRHELHLLGPQSAESTTRRVLTFSVPVAMQECTYALCRWAMMLLLAKYSLGETGLYTASDQWYSVIYFVPTLLANVVLSHLSTSANDGANHRRTLRVMMLVNLLCTAVPFVVVFILAPWIATFYGESFVGMTPVLRVLAFSTILNSLVNVLHSALLSKGRNWYLFGFRAVRDVTLLALCYVLLTHAGLVGGGAMAMAWATVVTGTLYFVALFSYYHLKLK